jgi:phenylalanine-4-hydroxylase
MLASVFYLNISKPLPAPFPLNIMMRTGLKLLIMSTYLFVVENVTNMDIFSEIVLLTLQARSKTLKQVNQKMDSLM